MTFSSFLKQQDPVLHKQYVFERFKEGTTGRATVVEEPKFHFEAPKFKKKINLPKASENPSSAGYLTARRLDPTQFYYAEKFKKFVNTVLPTNIFPFINRKHPCIWIETHCHSAEPLGLSILYC